METLPTEILEVIFMELSRSSLIDIVNCSRTCMTWKNIIEKMFKKDGKNASRLHMIEWYGTGKIILEFLPFCQLNKEYQEKENSK